MASLLKDCNTSQAPVNTFMSNCCRMCRNPECDLAGWAMDKFQARVSTQAQRLLDPEVADPHSSRYENIVAARFVDMAHQAMRLEISAKRGDWTVPDTPEIPIIDGRTEVSDPAPVDEAVNRLSRDRGGEPTADNTKGDSRQIQPPDPPPQPPDPPPQPPDPPPQEGAKPPAAPRGQGNTTIPSNGLMVDGSAVPAPATPSDPWAAPPIDTTKKIKVGGTVVLGASRPGKHHED